MQIIIAIGLVVLAIILFVAVKIRWITWIDMQIATAVSGVLAFIAALLFFVMTQQVSKPDIKTSPQTQDSKGTTKESGTASHDSFANKSEISTNQVKPNGMDKRKFNLFVDVAPNRAGAKVYIDDMLYANAAPCTVKVEEGTHHLKLEYKDSSSLLVYISSIIVSHDDVIRIESEQFKTK